jgi:AcrR family transcriptional regulator
MPRIPAAQRRQDFVDATVRVIAEHGLSDATTRRIADAAGAPLASLHYCFHSKDELFFAVFEAQAKMLGQRMGRAERGAGLATTAAKALHDVVSWFREHPDWAIAGMELELWTVRQDGTKKLSSGSFDIHIEGLAKELRRACGPSDDKKLAEPAARLIAALTDGLLLQWFAYRDDSRLIDGAKHAAESLALYISQGPGRRRKR